MTRGGRGKIRDDPHRRCIATGVSKPKEGLIRFVVGPDGVVVPDLAERLPGRGVWLASRADMTALAVRKKLFSRAVRRAVKTPDELAEKLEALLARRVIDAIGLARKAGLGVSGFEKVRARLGNSQVAVLIEARDGAEGGKAKLRPRAGDAELISCLDAAELGLAFGRESVVHAALDMGGAADRAVREARRLDGFRVGPDGNIG